MQFESVRPWLILFAALLSLGLTAALVKLAIRICTAEGWVAKPRRDRWHRGAPCLFGGVPLWAGFVLVSSLLVDDAVIWKVIGLSSVMLVLGFADDIFRLSARVKLLVQLASALLLVSIGVTYPISTNLYVCAAFSVLWATGITNAFNLLDNMDGLASGVALIAAAYLAAFYYLGGDTQYAIVMGIFAGAVAGFLLFNFNPARIFMGDAGSLPIGFFLGSAMLLRVVHLANVSAFLFIPVLLLVVPLFDTFFVSVTRRLRGQPISQGGTDHSSHRFVKFGLHERSAVLLLYGISCISGAIALLVRTMRYYDALGFVLSWFFVLFVFGVHLFRAQPGRRFSNSVPNLVRRVMSRDVLALLLDPAALLLAYYLSYILRFRAPDRDWTTFYESFPILLIAKFGSLYLHGTYRRSWWRGSVSDLWRIARAVLLGDMIALAILTGVYRFAGYSRVVFVLDCVTSCVILIAIRSSFRVFEHFLFAARPPDLRRRVFVIGTSAHTEVALAFLEKAGIACVGLIDSNGGEDLDWHVWGFQVLGQVEEIPRLSLEHQVFEVVMPQHEQPSFSRSELARMCREFDITFTIFGLHSEEAIATPGLGMRTVLGRHSEVPTWDAQPAESA
jgi:UDP-GlcNAc:undecaprenyl-phosphate/decaprenyl-phosphate GlcNAc-1-phosphate transferase